MFVYNFFDPELRVVIFKKYGAAGKGGADFEIGDIGPSAHLY